MSRRANKLANKAKLSNKTPVTRLLDLTCGWSNFVSEEHNKYPDTVRGDAIADLYQAAGALAEDYPDLESEQNAVRAFMTERVFPVLLQP